ncbi:MAG: GNAT family N-acetyltransferase [Deltaproteobacteria bacterium]|nr:GNAT family N-acetyltransferase [Deltaproteobacteria bacterium]
MIEIVRLREEHVEQLETFFEAINNLSYVDDFSPHPFDSSNAERICKYHGRDKYCAILLNGETIIGYGLLRGWDEGYEVPAIGLCILETYHGKGLGKLLLDFLETASRLEGASEVMLKVKKNNVAASSLYQKQGFDLKEYNDLFLIGRKRL